MRYEPKNDLTRPIIVTDGIIMKPLSVTVHIDTVFPDENSGVGIVVPRHPHMWEIETSQGNYKFLKKTLVTEKRKSGRPLIVIESVNGFV